MDITNQTKVTEFVFTGLTDNEKLKPFLFILILHVYIVTIVANVGLVAIVRNTSNLQNPMYYFLSYLSLVDVFYSSTTTPKMLVDLKCLDKTISFEGCALQFYFYAALASTESFLLSTMSYDRYVAICHPLHYVSTMTKKKCLCLVLLSLSVGFLQSSVQTSCAFTLRFCGPNLIDHFYCDAPLVVRLSCSDTSTCDLVTVYTVGSLASSSLITILISYTLIIFSVINIKSTEGRRKAFSTCSSHLMCVFIFYGTVLFTYMRPHSSAFTVRDKVASIFYTAVTPMLNPLIYSLRNQRVRGIISEALNVNLPPGAVTSLQSSFSFKWASGSLGYLGALPIRIPSSFFKELASLQTKFIWDNKPARISRSLLCRPKRRGGMGIPDLKAEVVSLFLENILELESI
ncbi:olfactory receptor 5B12-like [Anomaloglossus baeobatrachus]|uniref:olfactory receptor 5B12-like n=1 Tax=Anomaloglossus baeobatrachus TaxID=238106 RepID=UPI003F4FB522